MAALIEFEHITPIRPHALIAFIIACMTVLTAPAATSDEFARERKIFEQVLQAQAAGQSQKAAKLVAGLEQYPLYPYYVYADIRHRLAQFPRADVAEFLAHYENSLLATQLRAEWLEKLAQAARWHDFLNFYRTTAALKMRCLELEARIKTGKLDNVISDSRAAWLSAQSLPDECDVAFAHLYANAGLDDDLVWQRIELAMAAGNAQLANFLAKRLTDPRYKQLHGLWHVAHANPQQALASAQLSDDKQTRAIMAHAIGRLLRGKLESAEIAWAKISSQLSFTPLEAGAIAAAIATAAASADHPRTIALLDAVPQLSVTPDVERYRLRRGIAAAAWPQVARWTEHAPAPDFNHLRWRYWRARALREIGQTEQANEVLRGLAQERDYYGFLAADALGLPYRLNAVPVAARPDEIAVLLETTGLPRARELYLLGRKTQAAREWYFLVARSDRRQKEVAAAIAAKWQWADKAIHALGQAQSYDDIELRFPLLYTDIALKYAKHRGVAAARIMAIMRSESAFVADANSAAGARGLMQLMPATAQQTAKRVGVHLKNSNELEQPMVNIALGSAYLAQMLERYRGNFAMAAAAYNAGPDRVRQWQTGDCIDADIWIDTIPFTETRRYVRRAYFYTTIYEARMKQDITKISAVTPPIPARGSSNAAGCN